MDQFNLSEGLYTAWPVFKYRLERAYEMWSSAVMRCETLSNHLSPWSLTFLILNEDNIYLLYWSKVKPDNIKVPPVPEGQ